MKTFVDLGAFDGDTIRIAIKKYGRSCKIHAFEPLAKNFRGLKNRYGRRENIRLINAAADVKDGEGELYLGKDWGDQGGSLIKEKTTCFRDEFEVVKTLDFSQYVLKNFKANDRIILKMDIEGKEYDVLDKMMREGAIKYIREMYCEWHYDRIGKDLSQHKAFVENLRSHGFSLTGNNVFDEFKFVADKNKMQLRFIRDSFYLRDKLKRFILSKHPGLYHFLRSAKRIYEKRWKKCKLLFFPHCEESPEQRLVRQSVRYMSGPKNQEKESGLPIVLCVVRNGEYYMRAFLNHYFDLGVKHVVILDNGSTDDTISIAQENRNVTVLQTELPYRQYQRLMEQYLIKKYGKNRWSLNVDVDELFDYPSSNSLGLDGFIAYLNSKYYTAVLTHRLEMFSDRPMNKSTVTSRAISTADYPYYDTENITKSFYADMFRKEIQKPHCNEIGKEMFFYRDGIRKTVLNTRGWITKTALIYLNENVEPLIKTHFVDHASIGDVSCVLLHYYFAENYYDKVSEVVNRESHVNLAPYLSARKLFQTEKQITIKRATARKYGDVNQLLKEGFLTAAKDYENWVKNYNDVA